MEEVGEARAADGGVILGSAAVDATEKALRNLGAICGECDRPCYFHMPTGPAFTHEFVLMELKVEEGRNRVIIKRGYACSRRDCEGERKFAEHPNVIAARSIPSLEIVVPHGPEPEAAE